MSEQENGEASEVWGGQESPMRHVWGLGFIPWRPLGRFGGDCSRGDNGLECCRQFSGLMCLVIDGSWGTLEGGRAPG